MYIAFEGIVGTGKTTQSKKLFEYLKDKYPDKKIIWTREPGGTEISEAIRNVVQGTKFKEEMEPVCEAYLYAASRAQSLRTIVKPVLDEGGVVISDRSVLTSLTNQAFGRKLDFDVAYEINKIAVGNIWPTHIIFIDLPLDTGLQRAFDTKGDKFESLGLDFYTKVRQGYDFVSKHKLFKDKFFCIDGVGAINEVFERIKNALGF
jgi:dTMP kinase